MWSAILQPALFIWLLFTFLSALLLRVCHRTSFLSSSHVGSAAAASAVRRIGLVIAHPDDESMFFVPTLAHLTAQGHHVSILCLSTGNADGLGLTRVEELRSAARVLGVTSSSNGSGVVSENEGRVTVIDDEEHLADGMKSRWSVVQARGHIDAFVQQQRLDTLITFDERGVSDHPNHIATHDAVKSLLRLQQHEASVGDVGGSPSAKPFEAYALLSTPLWRKYAGLADALWSWRDEAQSARTSNGDASVHLVTSFAPWLSHRAMAAHRSQFVWYRRLFVLFSRYTFFNTLQRIESK